MLLVSFVHATRIDLGFAQHDRVLAEVNLTPAYIQPLGKDGHIDPARKVRFINTVLDRVRSGPGVRAVAAGEPADIVVNATSVGLDDPDVTFKALPLQADELIAGSLVVDLVYRAGGTLFLEAARSGGARVVDGLEILVAQGAASFERWTGRNAPREAMRQAVTIP